MIEIKTLEIAGMASVLQALRLPFGLECRSTCTSSNRIVKLDDTKGFYTFSESLIHEKDIKLLSTLIRRGDEHAKAIRGLIVYAEINAPRFWWAEADSYRIGTERLASESTMHIQGKGLTTEKLVEMKSNLTEGTMQRRIQYFSYQTLRRIYHQRITHRLPHWRRFCEWIETLPFFDELILSHNEN
jgi:hypothetical protein